MKYGKEGTAKADAPGKQSFLAKIRPRWPAVFASICLPALLLFGAVGTALCGPYENSIGLAQANDQGRSSRTNSKNAQSPPRDQSVSTASEPAKGESRPSDRNAPRQLSSPQKEFKPSEQIDVDKAVDFPADI
jgi:hypothetical protein